MACKNCMGGCKHYKIEHKSHKVEHKDSDGNVWMVESVFDGYVHFCDKNQIGYEKWHEEHKHDTYDQYKDSIMECYEPNDIQASLNAMHDALSNILEMSKKE